MEPFILYCGFFGAWLLVAGPILQAALELQEQDIARDKIHAARKTMHAHGRVSAWWWLIPPVKIVLERRNQRYFQDEFKKSLSREELEGVVSFMNKARGWWLVAGGAFLIALKETHELAVHLHWRSWLYVVVVILMLFISFFNTAVVMRRSYELKQASHSPGE